MSTGDARQFLPSAAERALPIAPSPLAASYNYAVFARFGELVRPLLLDCGQPVRTFLLVDVATVSSATAVPAQAAPAAQPTSIDAVFGTLLQSMTDQNSAVGSANSPALAQIVTLFQNQQMQPVNDTAAAIVPNLAAFQSTSLATNDGTTNSQTSGPQPATITDATQLQAFLASFQQETNTSAATPAPTQSVSNPLQATPTQPAANQTGVAPQTVATANPTTTVPPGATAQPAPQSKQPSSATQQAGTAQPAPAQAAPSDPKAGDPTAAVPASPPADPNAKQADTSAPSDPNTPTPATGQPKKGTPDKVAALPLPGMPAPAATKPDETSNTGKTDADKSADKDPTSQSDNAAAASNASVVANTGPTPAVPAFLPATPHANTPEPTATTGDGKTSRSDAVAPLRAPSPTATAGQSATPDQVGSGQTAQPAADPNAFKDTLHQAAAHAASNDNGPSPKNASSDQSPAQSAQGPNQQAHSGLQQPQPANPADPGSVAANNGAPPPAQSAQHQTAQPSAPPPTAVAVGMTQGEPAPSGLRKLTAGLQISTQQQDSSTTLDKLGVTIATKLVEGSRHFDIRLDPPELGRVDIRLTVDDSGKTQANLVVDKPQTLQLLQRDSANLNRALSDAGLDLSNNSLNFSLRDQGRQNDGFVDQGRTRALSAKIVVESDATSIHSSFGSYAPNSVRLDIRV